MSACAQLVLAALVLSVAFALALHLDRKFH